MPSVVGEGMIRALLAVWWVCCRFPRTHFRVKSSSWDESTPGLGKLGEMVVHTWRRVRLPFGSASYRGMWRERAKWMWPGKPKIGGMEDLQIPRYLRTIAKRQRFNLSCQTLSDTGEIPRGDARQRVLSSTRLGKHLKMGSRRRKAG